MAGGGRQGERAEGLAERAEQVAGDGPALGGDFEDFAGGIREVDEDLGWGEWIAFEADAMAESLGGRIAVLGAGLESAEDGAEGERGRRGFELGIVISGEPVAEAGRA